METMFPTFRRLLHTEWFDFTFVWPWYTTRTQSQTFTRLIAVALEEHLPLIALIESWAADERGVQKWRLLRLAERMKAGRSLADALDEVPRVLADADRLAIQFDLKMGTRMAAIRASLDASPVRRNRSMPSIRELMVYAGMLVLVGLVVIGFTQITILPKLSRILRDFSLKEAAPLKLSLEASEAIEYLGPVGLASGALLAWLVYASWRGLLARRAVAGRARAAWDDATAADVLQKLAIANAAGRPLDGALSLLARHHFDPLTRHKLLYVRNECEQGSDFWESLRDIGLLSPEEVRLLEAAQRVGNRPWALEQLAELRRSRAQQRRYRWAGYLIPVVVLGLGLVVLFHALSVFLPLTDMIDQL